MINRLSSDETLVEAMKKGDSKAFSCLFDRYWQKIYSVVFSVSRDKEVCSEIVHDIFLNLWLKREKLQIEYFKGYITASARYQVYRHVKNVKKKTIEYREEFDYGNLVAVNDGESNIRYRELERKVEEELEELPSRCREIFILSRMEQLTNDEIAARLDISKRTVENQLTHALHHLRISLKNLSVFLVFYFFY